MGLGWIRNKKLIQVFFDEDVYIHELFLYAITWSFEREDKLIFPQKKTSKLQLFRQMASYKILRVGVLKYLIILMGKNNVRKFHESRNTAHVRIKNATYAFIWHLFSTLYNECRKAREFIIKYLYVGIPQKSKYIRK